MLPGGVLSHEAGFGARFMVYPFWGHNDDSKGFTFLLETVAKKNEKMAFR